MLATASVIVSLLAASAFAGSIADIDHVVLFMQENRAFDHYFGTLAGVRGFSDPNVQINPDGLSVWQQLVNAQLTTNASYLLPFYLNYQGGSFLNATQCMNAGSNGWDANHAALNGGLNNRWATDNTPWSWGYYRRSDIPLQFAVADGWTVGDMYQESVIAATNPNRVTWASGSINVPGSPQNASQGGYPYIDNNETPGCEAGGFNCYPLKWKTTAEIYEEQKVSWSIFQDADNFDDNPFAWFAQYQSAPADSPLAKKGFVGESLNSFYARAANGTLPKISYIIGPAQLSEHSPYSPRDGAWLQKKVIDAVTRGPGWSKTALIISFDETGGWGDHVTPYHAPEGTPGEWLNDPNGKVGYTFSGPGFRLPFYIISPWTRGGNVFTEHCDHNSQILFTEQWLAAKGFNVVTDQMVPWRREHMSPLVNAFDFEHPDYSLPDLPNAPEPHTDANGVYDGSSHCESLHPVTRPEVPYGKQIDPADMSTLSEDGFKPVRGYLTEGRYITFESNSFALTNTGGEAVSSSPATIKHELKNQRWIIHAIELGKNAFYIQSAVDKRFIGETGALGSAKAPFTIAYDAKTGYTVKSSAAAYLSIGGDGSLKVSNVVGYFKVFSVTYGKNIGDITTTLTTTTTTTWTSVSIPSSNTAVVTTQILTSVSGATSTATASSVDVTPTLTGVVTSTPCTTTGTTSATPTPSTDVVHSTPAASTPSTPCETSASTVSDSTEPYPVGTPSVVGADAGYPVSTPSATSTACDESSPTPSVEAEESHATTPCENSESTPSVAGEDDGTPYPESTAESAYFSADKDNSGAGVGLYIGAGIGGAVVIVAGVVASGYAVRRRNANHQHHA
ncbi:phosphoesterase family-domain-containing protein [Cladochytrium replicatum]|nr:phosphoesterase family-domain-containing protein [Cladochytrium replicatum]